MGGGAVLQHGHQRLTNGSLLGSLAEGGLGVWLELFRASGYLTDFGGLPPAEYQAHAETEDGAEAAACAATLAADKAAVASLQEEIEALTSNLEAQRIEGRGA